MGETERLGARAAALALRYRLTLTMIWWCWGLLLFLLLAALSAQEAVFGDQAGAAWEWFLPNILPSMMLVGAAAYATRTATPADAKALKPLFLIALAVSIANLLLLSASLLGVLYSVDPLRSLGRSNLWLAPIQGLSASALGVFFTR